MPLIPFQEWQPSIGKNLFLAPTAWITGNVELGDNVSIFFGAVLRGDLEKILVGTDTNIQESALLHTTHELQDCIVGERVTIGHGAIIHGCTIEDECIIGMGSVILDGAVVGKNSIIGAQALVPMNMKIPERSLVVGVPAKVVRSITPEEVEGILDSARRYVEVGAEYRKQFASAKL